MTEPNTESTQPIEVRFVADGLVPSAVRAREIADMLTAVEDLVMASIQDERPDLGKDSVIIGLAGVKASSIGLQFALMPESVVMPVFRSIASYIDTKTYSRLPKNARDAVKKIAGFTRRHRCIAELRTNDGQTAHVLATIGPDVDIPPAPRVTGFTTIYGRVTEAGGKQPNAHIELHDGSQVICRGNEAQIKQLANKLYTTVGIEGSARWDSETFEILDFEINNIAAYDGQDMDDVLRELRAVAGTQFSEVDALDYVHMLRDDDSEI